jgi:hypothetical protein
MKAHLLLFVALTAAVSLRCDAQPPAVDFSPVVKDLQAQQANISENETKIEDRVVELAEAVRLARLYVSRNGGAHKPPPPPK